MIKFFSKSRRRRVNKNLGVQALESRILLSAFFVDGQNGAAGNTGAEDSPFRTIRQAVGAAMANPGDDEVVIQPMDGVTGPNTYQESLALVVGYTVDQLQGYESADGAITIRGATGNAEDVVIDPNQLDAFYIDLPFDVTIRDLTITGSPRHGVLNRSESPVVLDNLIVSDNNATGLLSQDGDLTIRNSYLSGNHQGVWVGAYNGISMANSLSIEDTISTQNRNHGVLANVEGTVTLTNYTGTDNPRTGFNSWGGSDVIINGGTFTGNGIQGIHLDGVGSAEVDGVYVSGNGNMFGNNTQGGGGIRIVPASSAPISITNSTITGNETRGYGGGIEVWSNNSNFLPAVLIQNSEISNNETLQTPNLIRRGGGVSVTGYAELTVDESVISGNSSWRGGGIHTLINGGSVSVVNSTIDGNSAQQQAGGATFIYGTLNVSGSTFSNNTVIDGAGGILTTGVIGEVTNTTVSGNTSNYDETLVNVFRSVGGFDSRARTLLIANTTITNNSGELVGGLISNNSINTSIANSLIAGNFNTSGQVWESGGVDTLGSFTSLWGNLIGQAERTIGLDPHFDQYGTVANPLDAVLGPLQDNGGLTQTHLPLTGSPALDALDPLVLEFGGVALPATDQRGVSRPQRAGGDIGAVEVENVAPTLTVDDEAVEATEGATAETSGTFNDIEGDLVTLSASVGTVVADSNGTWTWSLETDDGPGNQVVTITAVDEFGSDVTVDFDLAVSNVAPTSTVTGPATILSSEEAQFEFTATDISAADTLAGFTYLIDWNGDGTVDESVSGGTSQSINHEFAEPGVQTVVVQTVDKDGGISDPVSTIINVVQVVEIATNSSSINLGKKSRFQIVIYSTPTFDASLVDVSSIQFAGAGISSSRLKDKNRDGLKDLTLKFDINDTQLLDFYTDALRNDPSQTRITAAFDLTGQTTAGVNFSATTSLDLFMTGKKLRNLLKTL